MNTAYKECSILTCINQCSQGKLDILARKSHLDYLLDNGCRWWQCHLRFAWSGYPCHDSVGGEKGGVRGVVVGYSRGSHQLLVRVRFVSPLCCLTHLGSQILTHSQCCSLDRKNITVIITTETFLTSSLSTRQVVAYIIFTVVDWL